MSGRIRRRATPDEGRIVIIILPPETTATLPQDAITPPITTTATIVLHAMIATMNLPRAAPIEKETMTEM